MKEPFEFEIKLSNEQSCFVSGVYDTVPKVCDYRAARFGEEIRGQDIYYLQTDKNLIDIKEFDLYSGVANMGQIQDLVMEKINEKLLDGHPWSYGSLIP